MPRWGGADTGSWASVDLTSAATVTVSHVPACMYEYSRDAALGLFDVICCFGVLFSKARHGGEALVASVRRNLAASGTFLFVQESVMAEGCAEHVRVAAAAMFGADSVSLSTTGDCTVVTATGTAAVMGPSVPAVPPPRRKPASHSNGTVYVLLGTPHAPTVGRRDEVHVYVGSTLRGLQGRGGEGGNAWTSARKAAIKHGLVFVALPLAVLRSSGAGPYTARFAVQALETIAIQAASRLSLSQGHGGGGPLPDVHLVNQRLIGTSSKSGFGYSHAECVKGGVWCVVCFCSPSVRVMWLRAVCDVAACCV